jgi:hypothetical protein
MTRLGRKTQPDVLLGREPNEVGEGRSFKQARLARRGSFRPANRNQGVADFGEEGRGAHNPPPGPIGATRHWPRLSSARVASLKAAAGPEALPLV